jgi:hypothetical protein
MTAIAHQIHGEFIHDIPHSPDDGEARTHAATEASPATGD